MRSLFSPTRPKTSLAGALSPATVGLPAWAEFARLTADRIGCHLHDSARFACLPVVLTTLGNLSGVVNARLFGNLRFDGSVTTIGALVRQVNAMPAMSTGAGLRRKFTTAEVGFGTRSLSRVRTTYGAMDRRYGRFDGLNLS